MCAPAVCALLRYSVRNGSHSHRGATPLRLVHEQTRTETPYRDRTRLADHAPSARRRALGTAESDGEDEVVQRLKYLPSHIHVEFRAVQPRLNG